MEIDRRTLLTGMGAMAAAAVGSARTLDVAAALPRKGDFAITEGYTYVSGAFTHPMPIAAAQAYRDAVDRRSTIGSAPPTARGPDPKAAFAALVNAKPSEISYKWLMGDFPVTWTPKNDASGYFELGTVANSVAAALSVSIPYIQQLGVENIQRYRQPMLKRLQEEMPRLGFTRATPLGTTSPIVTFASKDTTAAAKKLAAAKVNVRVAPYWIRIAPSIYNDMHDVERLLEALS